MNHYQEIVLRWRELGQTALGIAPTDIPLEPRPSELSAPADDLRVLIRRVDRLIEAYGQQLRANSSMTEDEFQKLFVGQLESAMEGNGLYESECQADLLREEFMEAAE
jgi:hypothetical protein